MIPEWLSFQNKFIPSPYISLYLFTWYRDEILSLHKSFWNEFIPVFNPNEFSFWYDISFWYHANWKRTPYRDETTNPVVWGEWRMHVRERLRLSELILSCESSTIFILEQNLFRNETQSGIMWTAPYCSVRVRVNTVFPRDIYFGIQCSYIIKQYFILCFLMK